jgi:hypothetical protein
MTALRTAFNLGAAGDDVYAALVAAHDGLDAAQSARLNARLVLILANHVGDPEALGQAIEAAREGLAAQATAGPLMPKTM